VQAARAHKGCPDAACGRNQPDNYALKKHRSCLPSSTQQHCEAKITAQSSTPKVCNMAHRSRRVQERRKLAFSPTKTAAEKQTPPYFYAQHRITPTKYAFFLNAGDTPIRDVPGA